MRLGKKSFWFKAIIVILFTFLVSEIFLRISGFTGILSFNALTILSKSSKNFLLLLDNLVLFTIVIGSPFIIINRLMKREPTEYYKYTIQREGGFFSSKISTKTPYAYKYHLEGKGLVYGSIIGIIYTLLDFFIFKSIIPGCTYFCGFENIFGAAFSLFYLVVGISLIRKHRKK